MTIPFSRFDHQENTTFRIYNFLGLQKHGYCAKSDLEIIRTTQRIIKLKSLKSFFYVLIINGKFYSFFLLSRPDKYFTIKEFVTIAYAMESCKNFVWPYKYTFLIFRRYDWWEWGMVKSKIGFIVPIVKLSWSFWPLWINQVPSDSSSRIICQF